MQQMSKTMGWLMLALNVVLLILIGTMHNMAAMWLMGLIMTLDAVTGLVAAIGPSKVNNTPTSASLLRSCCSLLKIAFDA